MIRNGLFSPQYGKQSEIGVSMGIPESNERLITHFSTWKVVIITLW